MTDALLNIKTDSERERVAATLIAENNKIARDNGLYACQDTGQALFFVKLGDEMYCPGLTVAIQAAVRTAYATALTRDGKTLTVFKDGNFTKNFD